MKCHLFHSESESFEAKWFKSCRVVDSGFVYTVNEQMSRTVCATHYAAIRRSFKYVFTVFRVLLCMQTCMRTFLLPSTESFTQPSSVSVSAIKYAANGVNTVYRSMFCSTACLAAPVIDTGIKPFPLYIPKNAAKFDSCEMAQSSKTENALSSIFALPEAYAHSVKPSYVYG